jgi:DNA-binding PadR family transcriptional regulator
LSEELKLSAAGLRLLNLFAQDPTRRWSGAEIARALNMGSGSLYPLLAKFEAMKLLRAEWEDVNPRDVGRPRRRYYNLTALGARKARNILSEFQFGEWRPAWNT